MTHVLIHHRNSRHKSKTTLNAHLSCKKQSASEARCGIILNVCKTLRTITRHAKQVKVLMQAEYKTANIKVPAASFQIRV